MIPISCVLQSDPVDSNDPIGISGGLNQYVFCGNNPVNFTDPFGLYQYTTANPFLGFLHQMNPFNMDGSLNAQFAAAWALGMGDTASAMQWSGQGQLDDTCAGKGWKGAYWGAIGVSAAADAAAAWMIGTEALAANGSFNVANSVANRAASPFLRNEGARWFSQTQAEALMNGPRLANTGQGVRNLLTTFRYASPGNGEVVLNWITRTVIHANPFF